MARDRYLRQADVVTPVEFPPVTLIGAGGIGSFTALALTKLGVEMLTVYDDDSVEDHNISNQLYGSEALKEKKVDALESLCKRLTDISINPSTIRIGEDKALTGDIVISGVDSMKARSDIWKSVLTGKSQPIGPKYYIDGRIGLEVIRLYTVDLSIDTEWYEKTLYSDDEAEQAPCTARSIIYTGFVIAGMIASQVKKLVKKESFANDVTFDLKNFIFMC